MMKNKLCLFNPLIRLDFKIYHPVHHPESIMSHLCIDASTPMNNVQSKQTKANIQESKKGKDKRYMLVYCR